MEEIEGATELNEATDPKVKDWFYHSLQSGPEQTNDRVRVALNTVRYVADEKGPGRGVKNFIMNVVKSLDRLNASSIIKDKSSCDTLQKRLIAKLSPPELKERIRAAREFWNTEQRGSLGYFKEQLRKLAYQVEQGENTRRRLSNRKRVCRAEGDRKDRDQDKSTPRYKRFREGKGITKRSNFDKKTKQFSRWVKKCLNSNCGGIHPVNECPITSPEMRRKLLDERRANLRKENRTKNMKRFHVQETSEIHGTDKTVEGASLPDAEEGRYQILLGDTVSSIALGDYGADESAVSSDMLDKLIRAGEGLQIVRHDPPLLLQIAVKSENENSERFTASRTVKLTITILLPRCGLPVRIRNVPFLVTDQKMDETILGRPFLKKIGFDLERHLEEVGRKVDGHSYDDLGISMKSARVYTGITYNSYEEDPVPPVESIGASIGVDSKEEIDDAFKTMVVEARDNGMSEAGWISLGDMLEEYRDVFRIRLGPDKPVRLRPLSIKLKKHARPFRTPQRRYARKQRDFIVGTIQKLEKIGAVVKNPSARWASPALAVPKPGSEQFRFTVDLRGPNAQTEPIVSAMPHLESLIQNVKGSTCFAKVDMAHAYWQIPLAENSQEIMSIQTPLGVYSSTRLLQGSTDAGNHYQAVTGEVLQELMNRLLQWLDDFLLHARDEQELVSTLRRFFQICVDYRLKVHARKTSLFLREAKFCGRILSVDGVRFDPRRFDTLTKMKTPTIGSLRLLL